MKKKFLFPLSSFLFLLLALSLQPLALLPAATLDNFRAGVSGASLFDSDAPLHVSADVNTFDNARQIWVGDGNVRIHNETHELTANHVTVNNATGDVSARGNITLMRPGLGTWRGEELDYNFRTRAGLIGTSTLHAHGATIIAGQILSSTNNVIRMSDAQFTTCTNAPSRWHYHIRASELVYNHDAQSAYFKHATAWFLGVPIGYFPFWYRSLDGYGVRATPGYTTDWGAYLLGAYLYKLDPFNNPLHHFDGRFRLDYRALRGGAIGNDLNWHSPAFGVGSLSLYYLRDTNPPRYGAFNPLHAHERVRPDRHRIAFDNVVNFTERDRLIARVESHSDSLLLYDFFEENFRTYFQPDSLVSYTRRQENWAAGLTVSGPVDSFYDGPARLPEAWLNLPATPLGAGFFYETQSRAGWHHSAFSDWARELGVQNYDAVRLDTHHRFTRPFTLGPKIPVAVVPRAAWRGTWYSNTSKSSRSSLSPYSSSSDSGMRNLFELGAEVSTKFYGDFNEGRLLHILQPYADYTFIPASRDLDAESIPGNSAGYAYGFDRYDNYREWRDLFGLDNALPVSKWHGVRLGTRNLLQTGDPRKRRTLLDTDLYGAYLFEAEAASEGWGLVGTRTRYVPLDALAFRLAADYDPKENVLRYFDLIADFKHGRHTLSAGWLRRHDPVFAQTLRQENATGIVYARFDRAVTRTWGWGLDSRYNTEERNIDEIAGTLSFRIDCMTFILRSSVRPSYTNSSGIHQDANYKFAFMVRLNAPSERE